jgi:hypothetical protein
MELAVPSFVFTPGKYFPGTDCLGPVDDQMANLKITIDRGPTETGAETGRIHVGIFHTPDYSPPESYGSHAQICLLKRLRNSSLPFGSAFRRN